MIHFQCPRCSGLFQIEPAAAGTEVVCPNCQGRVVAAAKTENYIAPNPSPPDLLSVYQPPEIPQESPKDPLGPGSSLGELNQPPPIPRASAMPTIQPAPPSPSVPQENPDSARADKKVVDKDGSPQAQPRAPDPMAPAKPAVDDARSDPADATSDRSTVPPDFGVTGASAEGTGQGEVTVQDRPTTIVYRNQVIELRKLSPEEKARRRFRRNAIAILLCGSILIFYLLIGSGTIKF